VIPISRFVAVSFRPASSVLSRTFVRTGSDRFETARLTTDRPRARFSCMTESFTWAYSSSRRAAPSALDPLLALRSPRRSPATPSA
jgi:hypothetical protein